MCPVAKCGKRFFYFSSLKKHLLNKHPHEYRQFFEEEEKNIQEQRIKIQEAERKKSDNTAIVDMTTYERNIKT